MLGCGLAAACAIGACESESPSPSEVDPPAPRAAEPEVDEPEPAPAPQHDGAEARRQKYLDGCEQGDGQACFALGEMLDEGLGGSQDPGRARALYEQACAYGSTEGCDALGH